MSDIHESNPTQVNFVPVQSNLDWDEYFMLQAMLASFKSKDPNTKVGCVFVDNRNHQISMGYNGTIAGVDESQIPWGNNRNVPLQYQKYGYVIHSEANAIMHSKGSLEDSRCYVTHFPCNECAKLIASHRVREIIFLSDKHKGSQENVIAKKIFELSKIPFRQISLHPSVLDKLNSYLISLYKENENFR